MNIQSLLVFLWFLLINQVGRCENAFETTDALNEYDPDEGYVLEIDTGCTENKDDFIMLYISPSCLHCLEFIANKFEPFLEQNKKAHVKIKFLTTSAKDVFILKVLNKFTHDQSKFFITFKNFSKRVLATINSLSPTEEQKVLFKGSDSDPDMIKFQLVSFNFGFSEQQVVDAYPNMDEKFECKLLSEYKKDVQTIASILNRKELDLPLIMYKEKIYSTLEDAYKSGKKNS